MQVLSGSRGQSTGEPTTQSISEGVQGKARIVAQGMRRIAILCRAAADYIQESKEAYFVALRRKNEVDAGTQAKVSEDM